MVHKRFQKLFIKKGKGVTYTSGGIVLKKGETPPKNIPVSAVIEIGRGVNAVIETGRGVNAVIETGKGVRRGGKGSGGGGSSSVPVAISTQEKIQKIVRERKLQEELQKQITRKQQDKLRNLRIEQNRINQLREKLAREGASRRSQILIDKDTRDKIKQETFINNRTGERIFTRTNLRTGVSTTRTFQRPRSGGRTRMTGGLVKTGGERMETRELPPKERVIPKPSRVEIEKPSNIRKRIEELGRSIQKFTPEILKGGQVKRERENLAREIKEFNKLFGGRELSESEFNEAKKLSEKLDKKISDLEKKERKLYSEKKLPFEEARKVLPSIAKVFGEGVAKVFVPPFRTLPEKDRINQREKLIKGAGISAEVVVSLGQFAIPYVGQALFFGSLLEKPILAPQSFIAETIENPKKTAILYSLGLIGIRGGIKNALTRRQISKLRSDFKKADVKVSFRFIGQRKNIDGKEVIDIFFISGGKTVGIARGLITAGGKIVRSKGNFFNKRASNIIIKKGLKEGLKEIEKKGLFKGGKTFFGVEKGKRIKRSLQEKREISLRLNDISLLSELRRIARISKIRTKQRIDIFKTKLKEKINPKELKKFKRLKEGVRKLLIKKEIKVERLRKEFIIARGDLIQGFREMGIDLGKGINKLPSVRKLKGLKEGVRKLLIKKEIKVERLRKEFIIARGDLIQGFREMGIDLGKGINKLPSVRKFKRLKKGVRKLLIKKDIKVERLRKDLIVARRDLIQGFREMKIDLDKGIRKLPSVRKFKRLKEGVRKLLIKKEIKVERLRKDLIVARRDLIQGFREMKIDLDKGIRKLPSVRKFKRLKEGVRKLLIKKDIKLERLRKDLIVARRDLIQGFREMGIDISKKIEQLPSVRKFKGLKIVKFLKRFPIIPPKLKLTYTRNIDKFMDVSSGKVAVIGKRKISIDNLFSMANVFNKREFESVVGKTLNKKGDLIKFEGLVRNGRDVGVLSSKQKLVFKQALENLIAVASSATKVKNIKGLSPNTKSAISKWTQRPKNIRGLKQRTKLGLKQGTKLRLKQGTKLGLKQGTKLRLKQGVKLKLISGQILKLKQRTKLGLKQRTKLGLKQGVKLKLKQGVKLKLKQGTKLKLKQGTKLEVKTTPPIPQKIIPQKRRILLKFPSKKFTKRKLSKSQPVYFVKIKRKGRIVNLNQRPLTLNDAKDFLAFKIDNQLSRSAWFEPLGKAKNVVGLPPGMKGYFRKVSHKLRPFKIKAGKKKEIRMGYIEKSRFSLDKKSEVRQLILARKIKKSRKTISRKIRRR